MRLGRSDADGGLLFCAPVLHLSCIAAASVAAPSRTVAAMGSLCLAGVALLAVFAPAYCVLAVKAPTRILPVVCSAAFAVWVAVMAAHSRQDMLSLLLYLLLWSMGLGLFADGCLRVVMADHGGIATLAVAIAGSLLMGGLLGAGIAPHIRHADDFDALLLAYVIIGSILERRATARSLIRHAFAPPDGGGVPVCGQASAMACDSAFRCASQGCCHPSYPACSSCGEAAPRGMPPKGDAFYEVCDSIARECHLTDRERDVLPYLARGHSAAYCARALGIAEATVRTHIHNVRNKTGAYTGDGLIDMVEARLRVAAHASVNPAPLAPLGR